MMNAFRILWLGLALAVTASASPVRIDEQALGQKLGGWTKRGKQAAEYPLSGASYRTYKPEISPTPDGGIFVSVRIDHVRGWLASDDHAILEITIDAKGNIIAAQSSIAIQGRSISSDLIRMGTDAGQELTGADRAVKIGTDLVADMSAKLLREKIVEAGRVSYPAVLRHNYNLLFQSIRVSAPAPPPPAPPAADSAAADGEAGALAEEEPVPVASPVEPRTAPGANKLEIQPYGGTPKVKLPVEPKS